MCLMHLENAVHAFFSQSFYCVEDPERLKLMIARVRAHSKVKSLNTSLDCCTLTYAILVFRSCNNSHLCQKLCRCQTSTHELSPSII